jgi:hypothetical protein
VRLRQQLFPTRPELLGLLGDSLRLSQDCRFVGIHLYALPLAACSRKVNPVFIHC